MIHDPDNFYIKVPRSVLWILVFLLGVATSTAFHHLVDSGRAGRAHEEGHRAGYAEGRASCSEPSRLTQAAGAVVKGAEWLSRPSKD